MTTKYFDRERREEFPVVEKMVPLSPEEAARYRRLACLSDQITRQLRHLLLDALSEVAQQEEEMWSEVARKLGFASFTEAHDAGRVLSVNHLRGVVESRVRSTTDSPLPPDVLDLGDKSKVGRS